MRKSLSLLFLCIMCAIGASAQGESIYKQKFADPNAEYFTPENYGIKADGKMDVSDQLQAAINKVKTEKSFGTLYIPEGKYLISKRINKFPKGCYLISAPCNMSVQCICK